MSKVRVTVEIDEQALISRFEALAHDEDVLLEAHIKLYEILNPYVPFRTGQLAERDVRIKADGITYFAPWAEKNYYGVDIKHNPAVHPLATAYWDEVAMQSEYDTLCKEVEEILRRRASGRG